MPDTTYPLGYRFSFVTLDALRTRHEPNMHPEFARRLFAWLAHRDGIMGIGGGFRPTGTQPDRPGFAPEGRSFHQSQRFASGTVGYCAVDLVTRNHAGQWHRSPRHDELGDALSFGLHCPIRSEPWHMQPVEIRGHASWVNGGRRDPDPLPGPMFPDPPDPTPPTPAPTPTGSIMLNGQSVTLPTLRQGAPRSRHVFLWQRIIAVRDDGFFGPVTDAATREHQRRLGVTVDGIVGPVTWRATLA